MTIKLSNLYSQTVGSVILCESGRGDVGHLQGPGPGDPSWLLGPCPQCSPPQVCPHVPTLCSHSGTLPKETNEKFPEFSKIYYTFALKHAWPYGATDNTIP